MDKQTSNGNYDLTQRTSERENDATTQVAREQESDDANEQTNLGNVSSKDGDSAAENRVATSFDNE